MALLNLPGGADPQVMGLTLGRAAGDAIVLRTRSGTTIATITINDIEVMASGATTARVEVDAPKQVEILRAELLCEAPVDVSRR